MATSSQESLGAVLARVRARRGCTQLRLAELLCAASGTATVTRHEVSRWERGSRVPTAFWLRWLAVVLEVPLAGLERAAALARGGRSAGRLAAAAAVVEAVDGAVAPPVADHRRTATPGGRAGSGRLWTVDELRRLDDFVGGADLVPLVNQALHRATSAVGADPGPAELFTIAQLAQLAGWVNADAGNPRAARAAHRLGLRAARAAGDPALIGYLLGNAAQLTAEPVRALALARAGAGELAHVGSAGARALAMQRVAYAAARAGDARVSERALAAAERLYERRRPGDDPAWLYWLTDDEFGALTGRCYAALHRPRLAVPLLSHALTGIRQPRSVALYASWLAEAHLDAGAPDKAVGFAERALLAAVGSGSVRAATRARALHARLATGPRSVVGRYLREAAEGLTYLADVTGSAAARAAGSG